MGVWYRNCALKFNPLKIDVKANLLTPCIIKLKCVIEVDLFFVKLAACNSKEGQSHVASLFHFDKMRLGGGVFSLNKEGLQPPSPPPSYTYDNGKLYISVVSLFHKTKTNILILLHSQENNAIYIYNYSIRNMLGVAIGIVGWNSHHSKFK